MLTLIITGVFILSLVVFSWALYSLLSSKYGVINKRIDKRLRSISFADGRPQFRLNPERLFSKNASLNLLLHQSKFVSELDDQLVKSCWNIRADIFLFSIAIFWVTIFLLMVVIGLSIFSSFFTASLIVVSPFFVLRNLVATRQEKLEAQLPEILDFISRGMQAGHTFVSSLQMAANESPEPIASEFQLAFREISFGKSIQSSMGDLAKRISCPEMRYFAVAVFINHEIGGNLANLLSNVSYLIRERLNLKMSVHALTAEARTSAWILGILPFVVAGILLIVKPDFMAVLWREESGRVLVGYTFALMFVGVLWMKQLTNIRF